MSYYNQNQPVVGVPAPQVYPPEGHPKDAYPPPGYPPQGYPQGYPPPQQQQSSGPGCMEGWEKTREMADLIQDSNTNAPYGHSAATMKKGGLRFSGRKHVGGLSKSRNQFLKKASEKKVTEKNFAAIEEEIGARAKKNILKKNTGTRKVLSDISNTRNQTSSKKQNPKVTAVTNEPFHEEDIACEGFTHNHEQCIKERRCAVDLDHFLETLGLANDFPKELPSLERVKPESPPKLLEMMEEPEPTWGRSAYNFVHSPSPPISPYDDQFWNDWEDSIDCNFTLIDSPKLEFLFE